MADLKESFFSNRKKKTILVKKLRQSQAPETHSSEREDVGDVFYDDEAESRSDAGSSTSNHEPEFFEGRKPGSRLQSKQTKGKRRRESEKRERREEPSRETRHTPPSTNRFSNASIVSTTTTPQSTVGEGEEVKTAEARPSKSSIRKNALARRRQEIKKEFATSTQARKDAVEDRRYATSTCNNYKKNELCTNALGCIWDDVNQTCELFSRLKPDKMRDIARYNELRSREYRERSDEESDWLFEKLAEKARTNIKLKLAEEEESRPIIEPNSRPLPETDMEKSSAIPASQRAHKTLKKTGSEIKQNKTDKARAQMQDSVCRSQKNRRECVTKKEICEWDPGNQNCTRKMTEAKQNAELESYNNWSATRQPPFTWKGDGASSDLSTEKGSREDKNTQIIGQEKVKDLGLLLSSHHRPPN